MFNDIFIDLINNLSISRNSYNVIQGNDAFRLITDSIVPCVSTSLHDEVKDL